MASEVASIGTESVSFLNRDHIVLVTIDEGEIIVTTTAGTKITIPASPATLEKFVDDLANHVESNFVSITHPRSSDRFVDDRPRLHHRPPEQARIKKRCCSR
jgi:hypothetical protein